MDNRQAVRDNAGERIALIESSFERLTGRPLVVGRRELWSAPNAVVAHDTQDPPLFFYANAIALNLFRMDASRFLGLPSYKSAEAGGEREERARMFTKLEADDIVSGYSGIRIAADGTRFRIEDAIIWNLVDEDGVRHGQAATFDKWTPLTD